MSQHQDFERAGEPLRARCEPRDDGTFHVVVGDRTFPVTARRLPDGRIAMAVDGGPTRLVAVAAGKDAVQVRLDGRTWTLPFHRGHRSGPTTGNGVLEAPMTGTVLQVLVEVGQRVAQGDAVAVLSAMKMEHRLVADVDGTVAAVGARPGDQVEQGAVLVRIEAADGES